VAVVAGVPEMVGGATAVSLAVGGATVVVSVEDVEAVVPSDEVPSPPPQADKTKAIAAHKTK